MSGAMENRAAVFTSKPQAVEVYQAGAWWSGELLGWRHAADGSCQVWVRVVLGGAEETAWTDLETLRLPERRLAMAPESAGVESAERDRSVARHPSSRREQRADAEASATTSLPMVRDLSVVSDATVPPSGGRRRAPGVPAAVSSTGGRRRAPEEPAAVSSGGRRCAPETATVAAAGGRRRAPEGAVAASSGGRRRAPEDAAPTASGPAVLLGRHSVPATAPAVSSSVPADPGRHRTADTGMLPLVSDATATFKGPRRPAGPAASGRGRTIPTVRPTARPTVRPTAPETAATSGSASGWSEPGGLENESLTRPMRLSDHLPHSRRPRVDGSLRGV